MTVKASPGERRPAVQQNPKVQTDSTVLASSTVHTNSTMDPDSTMLVHVLDVMNIPFTIMVKPWGQSGYEFRRNRRIAAETTRLAVGEIEGFLHEVDRRFSPFRPDSLVSQARRGDWSALLDDGDFQEIYAKSALAKTLTHGAFDAFHQGTYDPTGLVKGWAIDKATTRFLSPLVTTCNDEAHGTTGDEFQKSPVEAVALNGGGDIRVAVSQHSDHIWNIGIENPEDTGRIIARSSMHNGAVATSGFSKRGRHITYTANGEVLRQLTVISDNLEDADMWATAGIASGLDSWTHMARDHELDAIAVRENGEILQFTDGMKISRRHTANPDTRPHEEPTC